MKTPLLDDICQQILLCDASVAPFLRCEPVASVPSLSLLGRRQIDNERRPTLGPIRDGRLPPVQLDKVLDDGEPETGTAGIAAAARARLVDAIEAFEDARQVVLGVCPGPRR